MSDGQQTDCTVLVVDDDRSIRETLDEALRLEGYRVVSAANGDEALQALRGAERTPDIILLDLMMPVMDGFQFLAEKKRDGRLETIPVVLFSALGQLAQLNLDDAVALLPKPLDLDTLLNTIERHCVASHG